MPGVRTQWAWLMRAAICSEVTHVSPFLPKMRDSPAGSQEPLTEAAARALPPARPGQEKRGPWPAKGSHALLTSELHPGACHGELSPTEPRPPLQADCPSI